MVFGIPTDELAGDTLASKLETLKDMGAAPFMLLAESKGFVYVSSNDNGLVIPPASRWSRCLSTQTPTASVGSMSARSRRGQSLCWSRPPQRTQTWRTPTTAL